MKNDAIKILQHLADSIPGVIYQFSADKENHFSFPYVSPRLESYFGVTAEAVMSDAIALVGMVHPADQGAFLEHVLESKERLTPFRFEGRFVSARMGEQWFRAHSIPKLQKNGSVVWDGLLLDVTDEKRHNIHAEIQKVQLAAAAKLTLLGEMSAGVAHEINNPLAILLAYTEKLERLHYARKSDLAELNAVTAKMKNGILRISKIVKGLKRFSRDSSGEPLVACRVQDIIGDAMDLCQQYFRSTGIKVDIEPLPPDSSVICRRDEIVQILINLLGNSRDAIVDQKDAWVKISCDVGFEMVQIRVEDSGAGIDPTLVEDIMNPFFTTKEVGKGTGLGLSISKGIAEAHHGKLFIDTEKQNTCFVLMLPAKSSQAKVA